MDSAKAKGLVQKFFSDNNYSYNHLLLLGLLAISVTFLFVSIRSYTRLRHIPGPFFAAWTNLVRRHWVQTGSVHLVHTQMHDKYGKVFRYGPNHVLISEPTAVPTIFGHQVKFAKSEFYDAIMPYVHGKPIPDIFATRDEDLHKRMKRPIASAYAMSTLVSYEPYVKSTMKLYFARLDELFATTGRTFDFGLWIQFFAWDVLTEITFSKRMGFIDKGADIAGIMENNWAYFLRTAPATQMPWLDYFWKRNPLIPAGTIRNPLVEFGVAQIQERLRMNDADGDKVNHSDFLSKFIKAKEKYPNLGDGAIPTWTNSNIQAGSDTTSILIMVVFYYLLKHPWTMTRLLEEIDTAVKAGTLSFPATWRESQQLPYLDACVKEASRIHPPIGFPLERIVPKSGITVDGVCIPGDTRVSMNAWCVHRSKEMFGQDADEWRPERWLTDEATKKAMYNSLLTFGGGHRTCLGKNISYLETYILVPTFLQRYKLELANPAKNWHVETKWFTFPTEFFAKISKRSELAP